MMIWVYIKVRKFANYIFWNMLFIIVSDQFYTLKYPEVSAIDWFKMETFPMNPNPTTEPYLTANQIAR